MEAGGWITDDGGEKTRILTKAGSGHNFFNISQFRALGVLCGEISGLAATQNRPRG